MPSKTYVHAGDSFQQATVDVAMRITGGPVKLLVSDPPYGGILKDHWDVMTADRLIQFVNLWKPAIQPGGSMYIWGGIGGTGNRPFFEFLSRVEVETGMKLQNLITWSKKRAYGTATNYLFTREELAWFVNGDKPVQFNIPLLEQKRGYAGYSKDYPAKSEFLRRTNVWTDITELFRDKLHVAQKPDRLFEIPVEVHTDPGDWVIDPFAGSGPLARACQNLGRNSVLIENDPKTVRLLRSCFKGAT